MLITGAIALVALAVATRVPAIRGIVLPVNS
jgi:hypothetical protein